MTNFVTVTVENGATLSTSSANIVAADNSRVGLTITNLDTAIAVYLAFGKDAVVEKGTALLPGVSLTLDNTLMVGKLIAAIAASGTPKVAWTEFYQRTNS